MQGDPYSRLITQMQKHGATYSTPCIELATVTSVNPLIVNVGDLQLDKDNLLIAESILENTREFSTTANMKASLTGNLGSTGDAGKHQHDVIGLNQVTTNQVGDHRHSLDNYNGVKTDIAANHRHNISSLNIDDEVEISGEIKFESSFKIDDLLAVMAIEDRQTYIILSKVVSINE